MASDGPSSKEIINNFINNTELSLDEKKKIAPNALAVMSYITQMIAEHPDPAFLKAQKFEDTLNLHIDGNSGITDKLIIQKLTEFKVQVMQAIQKLENISPAAKRPRM